MVTSPERVPIRLFSLISLPCSVYEYGVDTEREPEILPWLSWRVGYQGNGLPLGAP